MPVEVTRIPDEPIIHSLFTGGVTDEDLANMFEESLILAKDIEGTVYRITETRNVRSDFTEVMRILQHMSKPQPGSSSDPRFQPVLVGTDEYIRMISEASYQEQYGKMNLPLFTSFEEALAFTRKTIAKGG